MRRFLIVAFLALAATAPWTVARAHEERDVGNGQYAVEIGFRDEPAYLGQPNALFLKVTKYGSNGGPVTGLASSLEAEVQHSNATMPLALLPGAEPGTYEAPFIPTALGDYTFHLIGHIDSASIDESFRSSPTTFASVMPLDGYQFPVTAPAGEQLDAQLAAAHAQALQSQQFALAALVIGLAALLGAVVALIQAKRSAARSRPSEVQSIDGAA